MTIAYDILFRVTVHHSFYKNGVSADFSFQPAPDTQRLLDTYGLVFKKFEQGFAVFARVEPGAAPNDPPKLFFPIHKNSLRFRFLMVPNNNHFYNYTKFHNNKFPQAGKELLYFSNVKMATGDAPVLGDAVSTNPGTYLRLLNTNILNLKYNSPVSTANPVLSDVFGKVYTPMPFIDLPAGQKTDELQIDFRKINEIKPGRYRVSDANLPKDIDLYYEPELSGQEVFGIVDIFSDTKDFTNPTNDQVAPAYKFLNGDLLTKDGNNLPVADYRIELDPSAYELRYLVQIKPETLGVDPADLAIATFGVGVVGPDPDQAKFTSNALINWSEELPNLTLKKNIAGPPPSSINLKSLPNPTIFHPLKHYLPDPNQPDNKILYYDLNIYV